MTSISTKHFVRTFCKIFGIMLLCSLSLGICIAAYWLYKNGEMDLDTVIEKHGQGEFVLYDPALAFDLRAYKLQVYARQKPSIVNIGSSKVLAMRARYFTQPFYNMGGTADTLENLHSTIRAMLLEHTPKTVLVGIDLDWFFKEEPQKISHTPQALYGEAMPLAQRLHHAPSGIARYALPWSWMFSGFLSVQDFFALLKKQYAPNDYPTYGVFAKLYSSGFTPYGAYLPTGVITAQKATQDSNFSRTYEALEKGTHPFTTFTTLDPYAQSISPDSQTMETQGQSGSLELSVNTSALSEKGKQLLKANHALDYFSEIICLLRSRGVQVYFYMLPLPAYVSEHIFKNSENYAQFHSLGTALRHRGIDITNFSYLESLSFETEIVSCEFIDGLHPGEILFARILYGLAESYASLEPSLHIPLITEHIKNWEGHVTVPDTSLTFLPEVDFLHHSCPKR